MHAHLAPLAACLRPGHHTCFHVTAEMAVIGVIAVMHVMHVIGVIAVMAVIAARWRPAIAAASGAARVQGRGIGRLPSRRQLCM